MKRFSSQADHARRLAIFCFFALSILLLTSYSGLLTVGNAAQAGWRFEIEQGQKSRLNVSINNICKEPHLFGIKSNLKYLRFVQPAQAVFVGANSTELVDLEFDAMESEIGVYRDKVIVDCLDCKKEPGCQQGRDELVIEMSVVNSSGPTKPSPTNIGSAQANGSGLNPGSLSAVQCCFPPPLGMVSWWPMDGSLADIFDRNKSTSSGGISFVPGMVGDGVTFDIEGKGFIAIPQSMSLTNQHFTLDAWVRPDGPGGTNDFFGNAIIVKNVKRGNETAGLFWSSTDNRFRFIFGDITFEFITSTHTFPVGSFYHVAATYDGGTFQLYVNGQLEAQVPSMKVIKYTVVPWVIGNSHYRRDVPRTWNGVIDEVEIFNRALCPWEIQAIFGAARAGKCKP